MRSGSLLWCSRLSLAVGIFTAAGGVHVGAALAQTAADGAADTEIIVTAQRKEERLQQVPIAITAVSGADLGNRGPVNMQGIAQAAPSLNVSAYPNSSDTLSLNMRGQGVADAGQITKDGGVGIYFDGFYIARPQAALLDLGDPERIEVLRGPQGTLYGRNTTGGAVNIISKKPTGEAGGQASLTLGSRSMVRALASVDLPAFANIAIKGTVVYADQDGWVKNVGGKNNFHKLGQLAGRVAARWTPSSDLTIDYVWDHGQVTSTQPYYVNPDLVGVIPGYTANINRTSAPIDLKLSKSHFTDHQLTMNWDVSSSLTLRSLTGYRKSDAYQAVNYGAAQSYPFPGGDLFVVQDQNYAAKQWSQEFQVVGSIGELIDYTGGLYYFKENSSHFQKQQINASSLLLPLTFVATSRDVVARSISKAAYLQATITPPVLDNRLKLTVGGRYTQDKRRATRDQAFFDFPFEVGTKNNQTFNNFSPSVNLAVQWTPDVMTYLRWSRGYKAGGSAEGALDFTKTYGPEKVEAWEAGLKSQFFDRVVTFNASVFYNKFSDLQVDFGVDPFDLTKVATVNAGRARIKGAEIELAVRPVRGFGVRISYAYLDPKLKQILAPAGTTFDHLLNPVSPVNVGADVTSYFRLPFVPRNSLNVAGDWAIVDDGERSLTAYANYSYQARMYFSSVAGPIVPGDDRWLNTARKIVNVRLAWEQPLAGATVTAALFANNLLNRRSKEFVIGVGSQVTTPSGPGGYFSQTSPYSEPRVIGGEVKVRF